MFNIAIDRLSQQTYGKVSWLEKHSVHILLFVFLLVLIGGMWILIGKMGDIIQPLSENLKAGKELSDSNNQILVSLNNLLKSMGRLPTELNTTGLTPAP